MKRLVLLFAVCLGILTSCSQSPEKRRADLMKQYPNASLLSTPDNMTDDYHFIIWENDGNIYYSELDGQEPKMILSKKDHILAYKYKLILDEDYNPQLIPEQGYVDYLTEYNNKNIKYETGTMEYNGGELIVYGHYPRNKLAMMEIGDEYYILSPSEPNTLYCFDYVGLSSDDKPLWTTFSYDLNSFDSFHKMLLRDKTWKNMADTWSYDDGYSITIWADIKDDVEINLPRTFKYGFNEYRFDSFKQPQFLSELFNIGRANYFKNILIPEWVKLANPYKAIANMYETNIIEASSNVPIGQYYILYGDFEKIRYADDPIYDGPNRKYKYVLHTFWYDKPMIIYTDDDNFAKMDYPQCLWVIGRFDSFKSYGNKTGFMTNGAVFRDVVLLAHSPEYTDYPRAVEPYFLPAGIMK